jgi:hypothetical protein
MLSKKSSALNAIIPCQGRIQDIKLGGSHLKKLRRTEGGAEIFGVFRVKNHDFTPKYPDWLRLFHSQTG